MDLRQYYNDVAAVIATLPLQRVYFLRSIDNPEKGIIAGRIMDVPTRHEAAERIVGRTHVLASESDIAQFYADDKRRADELAEIEMNRKGQLAMPKELQDLVRMAVRNATPEPQPKQPAPPAHNKEK